MAHCTACGHLLGIGRFCTNCGQPVTPKAAESTNRPVVPTRPLGQSAGEHRGRPPRNLQLATGVLAIALLLLVGLGAWTLTRGDGPTPGTTPSDSGRDDTVRESAPPRMPSEVTDLTEGALAGAPVTAPEGQSLDGSSVEFDAPRMIDGDPGTAWRMPGDGTGTILTITLPQESVVTDVGLVNGYAKQDTGPGGDTVQWYRHNRRIERVTWLFEDGTSVDQDLRRSRRMQRIPVGPLRTREVRIRIESVSAPGRGPRGRDFTAISEVLVRGAPAE